MTENQTSKTQSAIVYQGWDEKTATAVKMTNKIENVKNSILGSIDANIKFYQDNKDNARSLPNNVKILKDVDDYTTVILKCGTFPIWKNTVKKGVYQPVQILNDLKAKVEADFFEKEIKSYLRKKSKQEEETTLTTNNSQNKSNKKSNKKTSKK